MELAEVADNIRKFREVKGLTREDLAQQLGLSLSGYSKIERGKSDISITRLEQISEILETTIPQLLNFDASNIFNISNNTYKEQVNCGAQNMTNNYPSNVSTSYLKYLEKEVERMAAEIASLKKQ